MQGPATGMEPWDVDADAQAVAMGCLWSFTNLEPHMDENSETYEEMTYTHHLHPLVFHVRAVAACVASALPLPASSTSSSLSQDVLSLCDEWSIVI